MKPFSQYLEELREIAGDGWDDKEVASELGRSSYQFTILGRAQQRGSKLPSLIPKRNGGFVEKNGRPLVVARDMNQKSKDWMQEVKSAAVAAIGNIELLKCPIELTARFYFARPQSHFGSGKNAGVLKASAPIVHAQSPDLAKLLRSLEDALTGVVWQDDKLVFSYGTGTGRYWTETQERTEVEIRQEARRPLAK